MACAAPAAMAAEAYLSPSTNGGSGAMPSGYSTLHFDLQNGDWAAQLTLPAAANNLDGVELSYGAAWSSRLDAERTEFADLVYLPINTSADLKFYWAGAQQRWLAHSSGSVRNISVLASHKGPLPSSHHAMTVVYPAIREDIGTLQLPERATSQAVLAFSNQRNRDVAIRGASAPQQCAAQQVCAFVFDADDGQWHARSGKARVQSAAYLPEPQHRWTEVVVGSPAEDITTPDMMQLPARGIDGDIYQISNPTGDHYARVSPVNTNRSEPAEIGLKGATFRYDSTRRHWAYQAN
ncbi:hypothetical protein D7U89_02335 [Stenotrophomonas maltophilia]|nr:hypothetical protein [Stenotrophomonas maltophilia]MBA0365570.1 hypothetical protein [Stenotrophomonas maltophilia]MBA0402803.1 hypothetical protein [Stenotrophomonas maltophilia]